MKEPYYILMQILDFAGTHFNVILVSSVLVSIIVVVTEFAMNLQTSP